MNTILEKGLQIRFVFAFSVTSSCRDYVPLLSSVSKRGDTASLQELINHMRSHNIVFEEFVFNYLLNTFINARDPEGFLRTIEEAGGIIPIAATSMAIILGSGFRLVSRGCLSSFAGGVFWAVPFFCLFVERGLGGKCLSEIGRYGT